MSGLTGLTRVAATCVRVCNGGSWLPCFRPRKDERNRVCRYYQDTNPNLPNISCRCCERRLKAALTREILPNRMEG